MKYEFRENATLGELYDHIAHINTVEEAAEYFEALVQQNMSYGENNREQAEAIERSNIGYWAGYFNYETMVKVGKLFDAAHPIFGNMSTRGPVTPDEALEAGKNWAEAKGR